MVLRGVLNILLKFKDNKSNCHVHLYFLVVSVIDDFEVTELKLCYVLNLWVQFKNGEWVRGSFKLLRQGLDVIRVHMCVTKNVNELAAF